MPGFSNNYSFGFPMYSVYFINEWGKYEKNNIELLGCYYVIDRVLSHLS